jgi:hypothetical protein
MTFVDQGFGARRDHVRTLQNTEKKSEKLGHGLHMRTSGIQISRSPRCGLTRAVPSLIGKFERGDYVIAVLAWLSFARKM